MIACTSPPFTERSMPCRISRPSASCACKSLISSIGTTAVMAPPSADAAFEAHGEQLLCFDREFHRWLFERFLAKSVDDQRHGVLGAQSALPTIEQLVLADLRG